MSSRARKPAVKKVAKRSYAKPARAVAFRKPALRGYGDYKKGGGYGSRLGQVLGEGADILYDKYGSHILGALTGFGDYVQPGFKVNTNSMLHQSAGGDPPMIVNAKGQNTIIRHREYIKDIVTSPTAGAFQLEEFVINPANQLLFPWLSRVCSESWQQYRLRGMVLEFKSIAADAVATSGTNNSIGTIIMATNYNAAEPAWVSKNQMENTEFATSAKQCHSMLHPIECAKSQTPLTEMYIGTPGSDEDEKMYNWGRFQIASVGNQAASVNIGELWVSYEIELFKPFVSNEPSDSVLATVHYVATGATASSAWFTSAPTRQLGSNMPITVATNSVYFNDSPTGLYMITIQHLNTATSLSWTPPSAGYTRCEAVNLYAAGSTNLAYAPASSFGGGRSMLSYIVRTTGANAIFTISSGTLPGTVCNADIFVSALDPNIQ